MLGVSRRKLRSPLLLSRLASLLLVLYVAAAQGLPALHLLFHRNDHVHEHGSLRWLRLQPHVHTGTAAHQAQDAQEALEVVDESAPVRELRVLRCGPLLQAASGEVPLSGAPHLAGGPLHGQLALLAPLAPVSLAPAGAVLASRWAPASPVARDRVTRKRARAPPVSI